MAEIKLRPGVEAEYTATLNEAGISVTQLVRFKDKLPQKWGGWEQYFVDAVPSFPRAMHGWGDLAQVKRLAVGSTTALSVISGGLLTDITPQTLISNFAENFSTTLGSNEVAIVDPNISNVSATDAVFFNTPISVGGLILHGQYPIARNTGTTSYVILANANATSTVANGGVVPVFTTVSGSAVVNVEVPAHNLSAGSVFTFPITTTVGGIGVLGTYTVLSIVDADNFTIGASSSATSSATVSMNGGDAQIKYLFSLGPPPPGVGFGLGGFGLGGFGTGVVPASMSGTPITTANWSFDNWGEFLMACPKDGGIYYWPPNRGYETAFLVASAPPFNGGIFLSMPARILVAWGSCAAAPGSTSTFASPEQQDPLMVRWCDQENFFDWVPTSLNQAGGNRISSGSEIRGALQTAQVALIFTDIGVWTMEYMGPPFVFGFQEIGKGCGLIAQHAVAPLGRMVMWMSQGGFFMRGEGSGVERVDCPVWDVIFQDLDMANAHKICAAPNSLFGEMTWNYPSIIDGTGENSRYVTWHFAESANSGAPVWSYGQLARSAWIDQTVLGNPIGATPGGVIYQHETGNNAADAPMNSYFETGYYVMDDATAFGFIDQFMPDMKWGTRSGAPNANVLITITTVDYPNGPETAYGPFSVNAAVQYASTRIRGRQAKFRVESNDLDSFWRMGLPRYRVAQMGRR